MSYTVFARKYRPQTFDDVIGQDHITTTLKNAIVQGRLAHAYIFVGPRGTGKTSTARIMAKALNCIHGPTLEPCGVCDVCKEIANGTSLDVLEFDAASNTQVDKIREIIIDNVKYAPTRGKYKLYIVDEVHMLSNSSFNALLKTLEEPPEHVKFIFATTDVQKVPTTILSRCQRFDLKRIPGPLIADHLLTIATKEGIALSGAAAATLARGAEGGMRDAESMLDQLVAFCGNTIEEDDVLNIFGFTAHETVSNLCEDIIHGDIPQALQLVHDQAESGKDLSRLLADLITHLRNLLVAKADPSGVKSDLGEEAVTQLLSQGEGLELGKLLDLIEQFADAESRMKWAPNKKMHFEIAVIRAVQTLGQATLTEVIDTLTALREGKQPPATPTTLRSAPSERISPPRTVPPRTPAPKPVESKPASEPVVAPKLAIPEVQVAKAPAPETAAAPSPSPILEELTLETPIKASHPGALAPIEPVESPTLTFQAESPSEDLLLAEPEPLKAEPKKRPAAVFPPESPEPPEPAPAAPPEPAKQLSVEELWSGLLREVRKQRPLIAMWVEAGLLLEVIEGNATIGFPPDQSLAMDYCDQANNRKFLEGIASHLAGKALTLRFLKREGLVITPKTVEEKKAEAPRDPLEEFKDDPLIRKALEIFRAEIQPA